MCLAVPGKILTIEGDDPLLRSGTVSFEGIVKRISLACVPDAGVGDYVLVHAGLALNVVDEAEAEKVFEILNQMGDLPEPTEPEA